MVLNIPTGIPGQTLDSFFALICLNNPDFGDGRRDPGHFRRLVADRAATINIKDVLAPMLRDVGIEQTDEHFANYSILPVFTTFLDLGVESRVKRWLDIYANNFLIFRGNMYCPHCALTQLDSHGFAVPSVAHQVDHVQVCVDHQSRLIDISPPSTESPFIKSLADMGLLLDWARPTLEANLQLTIADDPKSVNQAMINYARAVREALHRRLLPPGGLIAHTLAMRSASERRLHLCANAGQHLNDLIEKSHGESARYYMDGSAALEAVIGIRLIGSPSEHIVHPRHHLLAISVLFDDLDEYKSTVQQYYEKTRTLVSKSGTQPAPSVQEPEEAGVS